MSDQVSRLGWLPEPVDHRDCDAHARDSRATEPVVPVLSQRAHGLRLGRAPIRYATKHAELTFRCADERLLDHPLVALTDSSTGRETKATVQVSGDRPRVVMQAGPARTPLRHLRLPARRA